MAGQADPAWTPADLNSSDESDGANEGPAADAPGVSFEASTRTMQADWAEAADDMTKDLEQEDVPFPVGLLQCIHVYSQPGALC